MDLSARACAVSLSLSLSLPLSHVSLSHTQFHRKMYPWTYLRVRALSLSPSPSLSLSLTHSLSHTQFHRKMYPWTYLRVRALYLSLSPSLSLSLMSLSHIHSSIGRCIHGPICACVRCISPFLPLSPSLSCLSHTYAVPSEDVSIDLSARALSLTHLPKMPLISPPASQSRMCVAVCRRALQCVAV